MSTHSPLLPSPMSPEREAVMQARAARGETLSQPSDQAGVTESIRRRHASQRKDGMHVASRIARTGTSEARFDDDGEPLERSTEWSAADRYLATQPGTREARAALRLWRQSRKPNHAAADNRSERGGEQVVPTPPEVLRPVVANGQQFAEFSE